MEPLLEVRDIETFYGTSQALFGVDFDVPEGEFVARFGVETFPTLVVVESKRIQARLERPRGCREIETFLAPWLN